MYFIDLSIKEQYIHYMCLVLQGVYLIVDCSCSIMSCLILDRNDNKAPGTLHIIKSCHTQHPRSHVKIYLALLTWSLLAERAAHLTSSKNITIHNTYVVFALFALRQTKPLLSKQFYGFFK